MLIHLGTPSNGSPSTGEMCVDKVPVPPAPTPGQSVPAESHQSRDLCILDAPKSPPLSTDTSALCFYQAQRVSPLPCHSPLLSSEGSDSEPEEVVSQYFPQAPYGTHYQQGPRMYPQMVPPSSWYSLPWVPPPSSMPLQWPYWDPWMVHQQPAS